MALGPVFEGARCTAPDLFHVRATWTPLATADPEHACPVAPVVDIVFSRWTTPILWTLNYEGRQRFVELQRRIATIRPKVLTQRLRQLERDGLVVRTYHPEVPPRVEYEISDLGRSLAPLFANLAEWATTYLDDVEHARRTYDAGATPSATPSTPIPQ